MKCAVPKEASAIERREPSQSAQILNIEVCKYMFLSAVNDIKRVFLTPTTASIPLLEGNSPRFSPLRKRSWSENSA